ncbi:hypothetical protein BDF19DRAFT_417212 [Syncephalis fuscata]|nr:hypothetical protein BDF19DRAFT_417212 [Syncephalis fuscata]
MAAAATINNNNNSNTIRPIPTRTHVYDRGEMASVVLSLADAVPDSSIVTSETSGPRIRKRSRPAIQDSFEKMPNLPATPPPIPAATTTATRSPSSSSSSLTLLGAKNAELLRTNQRQYKERNDSERWQHLLTPLDKTGLLYLNTSGVSDDHEPEATTKSNKKNPLYMRRMSQALHARNTNVARLKSLSTKSSLRKLTQMNHNSLIRKMGASQLAFSHRLSILRDAYVRPLLSLAIKDAQENVELGQMLVKQGVTLNHRDELPKKMQLSKSANKTIAELFSHLPQLIREHKELASALEATTFASTPVKIDFEEVVHQIQRLSYFYKEFTLTHLWSLQNFENLVYSDKKVKKAITILEAKAPDDHQDIRSLLFSIHVSWFWRLSEDLHSLYTISRQLAQKRTAKLIGSCLDRLEKIIVQLWPSMERIADIQHAAMLQQRIDGLTEPLVGPQQRLIHMSIVDMRNKSLSATWKSLLAVILSDRIFLIRRKKLNAPFKVKYCIKFNELNVKFTHFNGTKTYGIILKKSKSINITLRVGSKKALHEWKALLQQLPINIDMDSSPFSTPNMMGHLPSIMNVNQYVCV